MVDKTKVKLGIWALAKYKIHLVPVIALIVALSIMQSKADYEFRVHELREQIKLRDELLKDMFGVEEPNLVGIKVKVTSYNPVRRQCDSTPFKTYTDEMVTPGMLAISRDLYTRYGLKMGQKVMVKGYGSFIIADLMNKRFTKRVDIISFIPGWSDRFGVKESVVLFHKYK